MDSYNQNIFTALWNYMFFDMSEMQSISENAQMSKKQGFFEHSQKSSIFDEPNVFDRLRPTLDRDFVNPAYSPFDSHPYLEPFSFYNTGRQPGLLEEKIENDPLTNFFTGKVELLKDTVMQIYAQIKERDIISQRIIYRTDYDSCKTQNLLYELEIWDPNRGINQNIERRRSTFERELITFEREKRMEYAACFRDKILLKRDLMNAVKEYKAALTRQDLILATENEPEYNTPQGEM